MVALIRGLLGAVLAAAALLAAPGLAPASAATPPINDAYLTSLIVTQASTTGTNATYHDVEDTTAATTQSDLFNPDPFGTVTSGGGRETTDCNGRSYGNTIWYDIRPKLDAGVELQAAGFGSVIALYQYSPTTFHITRALGCQASASLSNDYVYPFELHGGRKYSVQIGGLQTPAGFQSGRVEFKLSLLTDRDADGTYDVLDKCPTLQGVGKFAGCPPTLHPFPRYDYVSLGDGGVQPTVLEIDQIPSGARVQVRCQGCGVSESAAAGPHANSAKITAFDGKSLGSGDKLEIFVTKSRSGNKLYRFGAIGSYISYTARDGQLTDRVLRCLMPRSMTPLRTCPPGGKRKIRAHGVPAALSRRRSAAGG
jgi:hypothetical protein